MNEAEFEAATSEIINKSPVMAVEEEAVVEPVTEPIVEAEIESEEPVTEAVAESDDGYMTLEEYKAKGMDEAFYRGPKAFAEQKAMIKEMKDQSAKFKALDESLLHLHKFNEEQRQQEQEKLLREKAYLQRQLVEAREGLDFDKHDAVQARLNQVDSNIKPAAPTNQEPTVFANARALDPRINPASPQFDKHYNGLVELEVNESVARAASAVGRELTDTEIVEHINTAKKTIDDKFKPPPKVRPAEVSAPQATTTAGQTKADPVLVNQFRRWSKSPDPTLKEAGTAWLLRNGIK